MLGEPGFTHLKKAVNDAHGHVHSLLQQTKLQIYLHEPVNENGSHVACHLLTLQIVLSDVLFNLSRQEMVSGLWGK